MSEWEYKTSRVMLVPYTQESKLFREEFLASLFYRLREEETLHIIFPGMGMKHLNDFIRYMARAIGFVVPMLVDGERLNPVGLGWIPEIDGVDGARKATFGFGFFREMWSRDKVRLHVDLSTLMLAYWFQECKTDILYGTSINPKALNYSKRFGFSEPYRLPKFFCRDGVLTDAHVIYLEKERFFEYYRRWRSLTQ